MKSENENQITKIKMRIRSHRENVIIATKTYSNEQRDIRLKYKPENVEKMC